MNDPFISAIKPDLSTYSLLREMWKASFPLLIFIPIYCPFVSNNHIQLAPLPAPQPQIKRPSNANLDYAPIKEDKRYVLKYLLHFHKGSDVITPSSTRTRAGRLWYGHPAEFGHFRDR